MASVAKFNHIINLPEHDDKEIKRAVIPQTVREYDRTLLIFHRFLQLHSDACFPLNIKAYKGF
ncbi:hypothetical protein BDW68DRAFT_182998 [Aspergillus falconensis]